MRVGSGNFIKEEPFIVTKRDEKLNWNGFRDGSHFRCTLCGDHLVEGMIARLVFLNKKGKHINGLGNVFVCGPCDGSDVWDRLKSHAEGAKAYWWLRGRDVEY
jgi:hypothetical protein